MKMRSQDRQRLWDLTGGRCFYCQSDLVGDEGEIATHGADYLASMHIDHKVPTSRGGDDTPSNFAPACGSCNMQKSNRTVEEYRAYLLQHGVLARFYGEPEAKRDWMLPAPFPLSAPKRFARFVNPHHACAFAVPT